MIRFMIVSFLILGWAFYEMSGGADFVPESRAIAEQAAVPAPEPVVEQALAAVQEQDIAPAGDTGTSIQDRLATALVQPAVVDLVAGESGAELAGLLEDVAFEVATPEAQEVVETMTADVVETPQPLLDLRQVAASRVNMRTGPSTDYTVLITLDSGTTTEVIDRNNDGWVLVRVQDTGQEGWMAERLLEPVNG